MDRQLFRSRENKIIAGVCGGVAEYFSVDPTVIRIIWAAISLSFLPGGILAYIIAAIIIPEKMNGYPGTDGSRYGNAGGGEEYMYHAEGGYGSPSFDPHRTRLVVGGALVCFGALLAAREFLHFDVRYLLPLILIGAGVYVIYKGGSKLQ